MDHEGEAVRPSPRSSAVGLIRDGAGLLSRLAALIVLAIYLPALLVITAAVLASSPGPAFVKKAYRRGRQDGVVYLYEFRTECRHTWQPTFIGGLLLRTDLYRLPRLANVLLGQVGAGERVQPLRV